ncbi:MAG: hypothetical protein MUC35_07305 [Candidatus Margulisbacteria bacterium]|jgi:hypothetical protein|nr:hypothetical protein [Candidatus Margulisiibacteriota bacterium]
MSKSAKPRAKKESQTITARNRLALAYLLLANDKVFTRLPADEKNSLLKEVLNLGEEAADTVKREYGTDDPRKIAVSMGLKVFGEEHRKLKRSEYRRDKKEIVISRKFHEKLLREVESKELSDRLLKLVVAHELFHHLEAERLGEIWRRFKFKLWQLGPLVIERRIKGLSEVAAQAFTQRLLGLELTPPVFDYLLSINLRSA